MFMPNVKKLLNSMPQLSHTVMRAHRRPGERLAPALLVTGTGMTVKNTLYPQLVYFYISILLNDTFLSKSPFFQLWFGFQREAAEAQWTETPPQGQDKYS